MPPDAYSIRPATPSDVPEILALMRKGLGDGQLPRDEATWDWKHIRNPFGRSEVIVAEKSGTLIGLRAFMRWEWRRGEVVTPALRAVDTVTHPDWRGRGVFRALTGCMIEQVQDTGISFVFNTPNPRSRRGYLTMGWEVVGRPAVWARMLRPFRALTNAVRRGRCDSDSARPDPESLSLDQVLVQPMLARLLEEERGGALDRWETPKTVPFLSWRYGENPAIRYEARATFESGNGCLVIYRVRARGRLSELRICELVVSEGQGIRMGCDLIRSVFDEVDADFVSMVSPPRSPERTVARRMGFMPVPVGRPLLTVRSLSGQTRAGDLLELSRWRLSAGDLELF